LGKPWGEKGTRGKMGRKDFSDENQRRPAKKKKNIRTRGEGGFGEERKAGTARLCTKKTNSNTSGKKRQGKNPATNGRSRVKKRIATGTGRLGKNGAH